MRVVNHWFPRESKDAPTLESQVFKARLDGAPSSLVSCKVPKAGVGLGDL